MKYFFIVACIFSQAYGSFRQVKTKHFDIFYDETFEGRASEMANFAEFAYEDVTSFFTKFKQYVKKERRWTIYLNNQSLISNGFVSSAPRHMRVFMTMGHGIPNDFLQFVITHEIVHIVQNELMNRKFNRFIGGLFGEEGFSAAKAGSLANSWILEGQAVSLETILSNQGRGRDPRFDMELKALLLENKVSSLPGYYDVIPTNVQSWGLFPNQYVYGYFMSQYLSFRYGQGIWSDVYDKAASFPAFSFDAGIAKLTKKSLPKLHREMLTELKDIYAKQVATLTLTPSKPVSKSPSSRTDYILPVAITNNYVVALKNTYRALLSQKTLTPSIVRINVRNQGEMYLGDMPLSFGQDVKQFSYANGYLVWAENVIEPGSDFSNTYAVNKNRNRIVIQNIKYHLAPRTVVGNSRYFFPALSPDGKEIAVVVQTPLARSYIAIISAKNGAVIKKFFDDPNPETNRRLDDLYYDLSWGDNQRIAFIRYDYHRGSSSIEVLNTVTGSSIPYYSDRNITSNLFMKGDFILFDSSFSGINNVYALDTVSKSVLQVTSEKYGAFSPSVSPDGRTVYYSRFESSKKGYRIASLPFNPNVWTPIGAVPKTSISYFRRVENQIGTGSIRMFPDGFALRTYKSQPYSVFDTFKLRAMNISVGIPTINKTDVDLSFTFYDVLQRLKLKVGGSYNYLSYKETYPNYATYLSIGSTLPYLSLQDEVQFEHSTTTDGYEAKLRVVSISNTATIGIPLNFSLGTFRYRLEPSAAFTYDHILTQRFFRIRTSSTVVRSKKEGGVYVLHNPIFTYTLQQDFIFPFINFSIVGSFGHHIIAPVQTQIEALYNMNIAGFYGIDTFKFEFGMRKTLSDTLFKSYVPDVTGYVSVPNKLYAKVLYSIPVLSRGSLGPIMQFHSFVFEPFYEHVFVYDEKFKGIVNDYGAVGLNFYLRFYLFATNKMDVGVSFIYLPKEKKPYFGIYQNVFL